jgi:hypothetical protein
MEAINMETIKTMKISEMIAMLTQAKKDLGDMKVLLSSDSEGNGYGTLNAEHSLGCMKKGITEEYGMKCKTLINALVLYPFEEGSMDELYEVLA